MTDSRIGRWLLVALVIAGLAFTASVVSAHGDDPTGEDAPPYDGTTPEWVAWMEAHMTDHMGPGSVEWMESHMGVTIDEMTQGMADGDYDDHRRYGQGRGVLNPVRWPPLSG